MNSLEKEIFELVKEINPQSLYVMGLEELGDQIYILSKKNVEQALAKIRKLKEKCLTNENGKLARKYLESLETVLEFEEPMPDVAMITETLSVHLIKEGVQPERYKKLLDQMAHSLSASLEKFEGKLIPTGIRILVQYQILGVREVLEVVEKEGKEDTELLEKIARLRERVLAFSKRFEVEGFTDGNFEEVMKIMEKTGGAELARAKFYPKALRYGFDYSETPAELERKAVSWIDEELPRFKAAVKALAKIHGCEPNPEAVDKKLSSIPGLRPDEALAATLKIRPAVQALCAESVVGFNPKYETTVVETPSYLTPVLPTAAAMGFDSLTDHPTQRYFLTTDPKRAPPAGFAELVNTLVHEEYGHCLHFSNTSTHYAATVSILELLPSFHVGTTSEGLSFQRELEFMDALRRLDNKLKKHDEPLSEAEQAYVDLTKGYGGFDSTFLEMELSTYRNRIIRFLRVVGDARINSGKQALPEFLKWAEKKTGLSARTVYFQIFPAHEGSFPGYATCYALVGQEIKAIQKPFRDDPEKLVEFNAYACSMGYPAQSIFIKRLREYAAKLQRRKKKTKSSLRDPRPRKKRRKQSRKDSKAS